MSAHAPNIAAQQERLRKFAQLREASAIATGRRAALGSISTQPASAVPLSTQVNTTSPSATNPTQVSVVSAAGK